MKIDHVTKTFGDKIVFDDFSAFFPEGKVSVIVGPSGKGTPASESFR